VIFRISRQFQNGTKKQRNKENRFIGILKRIGLIKEQEETEVKRQAEIIDRKLHGLINSLRRRV
jgi:hypothetical protein